MNSLFPPNDYKASRYQNQKQTHKIKLMNKKICFSVEVQRAANEQSPQIQPGDTREKTYRQTNSQYNAGLTLAKD